MNDLNALHVFLALMQTNSTTRAALKLGRSQSYVSKVLAQLRVELDDQLFIRTAEGLSPTSYAVSIEPKLRAALEQVNQALEPEEFNPKFIDKITLHIVEPYLITIGKDIIDAIRKECDAVIDIRQWNALSETMIQQEVVDIGIHLLSNKAQTLHQKPLFRGCAYFEGNKNGDYIKYVISGVNEFVNRYEMIDPAIEPKIYTDNHILTTQLMDQHYTLRYAPDREQSFEHDLDLTVAIITKASRRQSEKIQWLTKLLVPIIETFKGY
ncbi:LysR family transcriptional regulator [Photobacterium lutimaris]|uniref:LysR family transcriptional regulator n=1 Tax=Photobacterium lutimaris TaxID=388278 RepID=A0A2T3J136_9GAMM|nr:LysR family transcriptional regulator [Photobacterium lutimaris]PSU34773.1 LysR family transcriptional regulator [Photobacterium lutimaris]TDR77096.1 transcriptional regulator [Photobacterium lutimaris]